MNSRRFAGIFSLSRTVANSGVPRPAVRCASSATTRSKGVTPPSSNALAISGDDW